MSSESILNATKLVLNIASKSYQYFSLKAVGDFFNVDISKLPYSLKVLLENLLRNQDGISVTPDDIKALLSCMNGHEKHEINYKPARVLMQDFTGIPVMIDLASMRSYMHKRGKKPEIINPRIPVDLIIDHSVQVDKFGNNLSFEANVKFEIERNLERYKFLKWCQLAFKNFRLVPPGAGICHQVNLEYLAQIICIKDNIIYPDTLVGTDSHTTMINALSILGWGVGGIEAEAVMLGQSITMLIPKVIGVKLVGNLPEGTTATDLVLTVTHILRSKGVVGKFVEFYGSGLDNLSIADRATIANMAPEYGATCGFFPIDQKTLDYLYLTGRSPELIEIVEVYVKEQGLWRTNNEPLFSDTVELDLSRVEPVIAGPKRPQDKIFLPQVAKSFSDLTKSEEVNKKTGELKDGDIVIAAITSCTNTSNPSVMVAAGLVARNAQKLDLKSKPWVKTSLAPGSKVVTEYLQRSGLQDSLNSLGFYLVGYGCTTCIGNSGPLDGSIETEIKNNNLKVTAVLSGNRNFEGRIHPLVKANYLTSPPLVVVYALAGTINIDLTRDPICKSEKGKDVYLKDIWPTNREIENIMNKVVTRDIFIHKYKDIFSGDKYWHQIRTEKSVVYNWVESTYIQDPPYFENFHSNQNIEIKNAKILAIFGDSITTDHISPAGNISMGTPAADYLQKRGVSPEDFNSYGARRGNHNIMMRGTFANVRIRNEMVSREGGYTKYSRKEMSIFDAAMLYKRDNVPLIIVAGKEYGTGSSRDWAAKGTSLLGIKVVIAESFERIHRSNLVGMGVLPLVFCNQINRKTFNGTETVNIKGELKPHGEVDCTIRGKGNVLQNIKLKCCIETAAEVEYFKSGGVLQYVLLNM